MPHVCPWWLAYTFDHRGRRLFHKPERIVGLHVTPGMTVLDLGCGMGYFSIPMAQMVGETGHVLATDLQQRMLDVLMKRARKAGIAERIQPIKSEPDTLGVTEQVDFALAAYVVHETPDQRHFLEQVYACLKPSAKLLILEPPIEVSELSFQQTLATAESIGFTLVERPRVRLSYCALLRRE